MLVGCYSVRAIWYDALNDALNYYTYDIKNIDFLVNRLIRSLFFP